MKMLDYEDIEDCKLRNPEDIMFFGTGGYDIFGEYVPNNNYIEIMMSTKYIDLPFNIYGTIKRRLSKGKKRSTIGWEYNLYISLFYSNGRDILYKSNKVKTLKKVRESIFNDICNLKTIDFKKEFKDEIESYKNRKKSYVFIFNKDNFEYAGVLYNQLNHYYDMVKINDTKLWVYKDDKMLDFNKYPTDYNYFVVSESRFNENELSISESKLSYWSYSNSGNSETSFKEKFGEESLNLLKSCMLENCLYL